MEFCRAFASKNANSSVFFYHYNHLGSFSTADVFGAPLTEMIPTITKKLLGFHYSKGLGVCHFDEIPMLFRFDKGHRNLLTFQCNLLFSQELPFSWFSGHQDASMSMTMVDLWANFATYHNPTHGDATEREIANAMGQIKNTWKSVQEAVKDKSLIYVKLKNSLVLQEKDWELEKRLTFWKHFFEQ